MQQEYQLADLEQRALYINRLLDLVAQLPSPIERTMRLQALAEEFGLDLAMLEEQLAQVSYRHRKDQAKESDSPKQDSVDKWAMPIHRAIWIRYYHQNQFKLNQG